MERRFQTGGQTLVREINLSTVLRYVHARAPISRASLATLSGLNKTTISSLVEELTGRGLVHEVGLDNSGAGRPARLLALDPQAGCTIGVALGVDYISVVLADIAGRVRWRRLATAVPATGQDEIMSQTLAIVSEAQTVARAHDLRMLGLGLAVPGTVWLEEGVLIFSPNLQWRQVPFGKIFHQHTDLPVWVDNDANAAAEAEHLFGVAREMQHFISVFAGVGVGGGLFLNGELYRGANGYAGEIGHTSFLMESYRPPCRCGHRGCWETYTNQYALIERVRSRLAVGRASMISQLMEQQNAPLSVPLIIAAAREGDTEALEALSETGTLLGLGVANLISIFNPQMVVLGGALSAASEFLLPPMLVAIEQTTMPEILDQVRVLVSAFGPDASVMGAAALVVKAILSNPGRVTRLP